MRWMLALMIAGAACAAGPDADDMVLIPAGEVKMGSTDGMAEEKPVHRVKLAAFWIDRREVTNRRFAAFVKATGYQTEAEKSGGGRYHDGKGWKQDPAVTWRSPFKPGDTIDDKMDWPVVQVSWNDAVAFCQWAGKRLPTEAEWERAARGGADGKTYPWGDEEARGRAHFGQSSATGRPVAVGGFPANAFGLHDMAGNVFEWCADWFDEAYYKASPKADPKGPDSGTYRVVRGGSWENSGNLLRCSYRDFNVPSRRVAYNGFRCARSP